MSSWFAQKSADRVFFHCYYHVILQENIRFVYLLESPRRGNSNKYTKRFIHKKNCSKGSVIHAFGGSTSSFFITAISINSKIIGNKQCRYDEGPLYDTWRSLESQKQH